MELLLTLGAALGEYTPAAGGGAFAESHRLLVLLALAAGLGSAAVAARRGRLLLAVKCGGLTVAGVAGLLLVPRFGVGGAVLSLVLGGVPMVVASGRALVTDEAEPMAPMVARRGAAPRRKRVLVGSANAAGLLDRTVFGDGAARRAELRVMDGGQAESRLVEQLREETPDEVYVDLGARIDEETLARAGARMLMDGVSLHFLLPHVGRPAVRAATARRGTHSVISLHPVRDGVLGRALRRALDVVGAGGLLVVLGPLLAVVAALVWWRMGRPVLFAQQRIGRSGRLFRLYKFRSMVTGADAILRRSPEIYRRYVASNFKLPVEEDPRITRLGRFLRRTSLDELPQLWNVLRGDMSLVGPRAIVPDELANYGDYARMLLRIKPGLTGLWQVTGRSTIGYPERARIDLHYVQGRSLRQDLELLVRTLPAVLKQRGAI